MSTSPAPAPAPGRCAVTVWPSLGETEGTPIDTTWPEFFASFTDAPRFRGDMQHPGWSAAIVEPCVRAKSNVVGMSALVLDYDDGATVEAARAVWIDRFGLIHTTRKHTTEASRFRVILPFTRIVTPDDYEIVWRWAEKIAAAASHTIDPATKDVSRFWYMPGVLSSGVYECVRLVGTPLDPDPIITSHKYAENERQRQAEQPSPITSRGYGNRALESACNRIRQAAEGTRNDTLNKEAFSIARLVAGGEIDDAVARRDLREAAISAKLTPTEVTKTLGSAFSSGLQSPRKAPALRPVVRRAGHVAGTGTDGPAPEETPEEDTRPAAIFHRGDHVELAERVLADLETDPMTFDDGEFWRYEPASGLWRKIPVEFVEHTASSYAGAWVRASADKVKPLLMSHSSCRGAASIARNTLCSRPSRLKFDAAVPGVAFRDRFVTVENGQIKHHAHNPEHLARAGLPFDYDPLPHPEMDRFFADLFEGCDDAADRIHLLQEFVGASLLGMAPAYQRCLVLFGTGNNGKSQVLEVCRAAFPEGTVVSLPPQQWDERFRLPLLVGALANFVGELPSREIAGSETFKGIVTGDPQTAERKNRDAFTFTPRAGNLFGSNSLPTAGDITAGFFRRFLILPLTKVFPESGDGVERDIGKRIAAQERQAIAAWAIEGARRLQEQGGYTVPASATALKASWTRDSDSVLLFLDTMTVRVEKRPGVGLAHRDLYTSYAQWAKSCGFMPVNMSTFGKRYANSNREHATIDGRARYYVRVRDPHEM